MVQNEIMNINRLCFFVEINKAFVVVSICGYVDSYVNQS